MIRIVEITLIHAPIERVFDLARSVEVHLAGNIHFGEQAVAERGATTGLLALGDIVTWRARHFSIRQRLTSQITAFRSPHYFQDTMLSGAFQSMQHDHAFHAVSAHTTEMRDTFTFAAPLRILGRLAEVLFLRRYMCALLRERNAVIRRIAESSDWQHYLPSTQPKLLSS